MFGPLAQHGPRNSSWPIPAGFLGTNPFQGASVPLRGCFLQADLMDHQEVCRGMDRDALCGQGVGG